MKRLDSPPSKSTMQQLQKDLDACKHAKASWQNSCTSCIEAYDDCNSLSAVKDSRIRFLEKRVQQQNYIATGLSVMCFTLTWIVASKKY